MSLDEITFTNGMKVDLTVCATPTRRVQDYVYFGNWERHNGLLLRQDQISGQLFEAYFRMYDKDNCFNPDFEQGSSILTQNDTNFPQSYTARFWIGTMEGTPVAGRIRREEENPNFIFSIELYLPPNRSHIAVKKIREHIFPILANYNPG